MENIKEQFLEKTAKEVYNNILKLRDNINGFEEIFDLTKLTLEDIDTKKNTIKLYSFYNKKFKKFDIDKVLESSPLEFHTKKYHYNILKRYYGPRFKIHDFRINDLSSYRDKKKLTCRKCGKVYEKTYEELLKNELICTCQTKEEKEEYLKLSKDKLDKKLKYKFDLSSITVDLFDNINLKVNIKCMCCGESYKVSLWEVLHQHILSYSNPVSHNCSRFRREQKKLMGK